MNRKAWEVTGYAINGDTYCVDCIQDKKEELNVIFISSETDFTLHCSECREEIETSVIGE